MAEPRARRQPRWCKPHHRPRVQCDPERDTHTQPLRCGDGLIAKVTAKARAMGLNRNDGIVLALQEWAGAPADPASLAATVEDLRAQMAQVMEQMSPEAAPGQVKFADGTGERAAW
jgi:hypothetical protein